MEIAAIGTEETVTAFRLGGVGRFYLETEHALPELLADKELGIVLVTEKFAEKNRNIIEKHRVSDVKRPIVIEVPDISGHDSDRDDPIDRLLRRAIGTDIGES